MTMVGVYGRFATSGLLGASLFGLVAGCGALGGSGGLATTMSPVTTVTRSPSTSSSGTAPPTVSGSAGKTQGRPQQGTGSPTGTDGLGRLLDQLASDAEAHYGGSAGIAVAPTGGENVRAGGTWSTGVAWSTAKVPVAMAALRARPESPQVKAWASRAIRQSDNAAAEALWSTLGDPRTAGASAQREVRALGDHTTSIQWQRVRPPYTAFGQTQWSLRDQALAAASLPCSVDAAPVLVLMGEVDPSQAFGLGHIAGARFKGGWGPDASGRYLVRQLGVVTTPDGTVGVALASAPASGSFESATAAVSLMAQELSTHLDSLPSGHCATP